MKIFAISDMHSYLTPTLKALQDAGWNENNPEHIIVVCGDALDRGNETAEMVKWLIDLINKGKLIYVKGNHDILMQQMLDRGYSEWHDKHNGTEKSYYQLLNAHTDMMDGRKPDEIVREVLQPLYDKMVSYLETERFVFCHSWVPLYKVGKTNPIYTYREDWRNATDEEFELAMWSNPFEMAEQGLNQTGKVLIFGHFHTTYPRHKYRGEDEFGPNANFDIYYGDGYIAIDGCIAAPNGKINILTIEDEFING